MIARSACRVFELGSKKKVRDFVYIERSEIEVSGE